MAYHSKIAALNFIGSSCLTDMRLSFETSMLATMFLCINNVLLRESLYGMINFPFAMILVQQVPDNTSLFFEQ